MGRRVLLRMLLAGMLIPSSAGAASYSNPAPIASAGAIPPETASPYPSSISVGGEVGTVTRVRVTLSNMGGGDARDLDALLVGPGASSLVISDICSTGGIVGGFGGSTLLFDDDALTPIPEMCASPGTGTYKPSNYDAADAFPGIPGPYTTGFANFSGLAPNGTWSLYVVDDSGNGDSVSIDGGWTLELTTTAPPPTATGQRAAALAKCKRKTKRKKRQKCRRRALKLPV